MTRNGRHDGQPQQRLPPGIVLPQQVGVQQQIVKTDLADSVLCGFVVNGQPMIALYAGMSKLEQAALMMAQGILYGESPLPNEVIAKSAVELAREVLAECAKPEEPQPEPTTEGE